MATYIGTATSRIDGKAKVTGEAKYAGEFNVPGLAYGYVVESTIPRGRITRIDATTALQVGGVIDVLTHQHRPQMADSDNAYKDEAAPEQGSPYRPLYDDKVQFSGQPIALVVAEDWETARFAASWLQSSTSRKRTSRTCMRSATKPLSSTNRKKPRGDAEQALRGSRRTTRRRIFHSDRTSQSDGAVRLDRDLGRRRQAHGLRQDARRTERAAISVQRVRHAGRRGARLVALHGRRVRFRLAPAIPGRAGSAGGARAQASGARRADPPADVRARLSPGDDRASRDWSQGRRHPRGHHA